MRTTLTDTTDTYAKRTNKRAEDSIQELLNFSTAETSADAHISAGNTEMVNHSTEELTATSFADPSDEQTATAPMAQAVGY